LGCSSLAVVSRGMRAVSAAVAKGHFHHRGATGCGRRQGVSVEDDRRSRRRF
jgi:hypothetical protein